jgi:hypothetical protein
MGRTGHCHGRLEERLNRNSKNSSQPPSQDAPQAKSGKGDKGGFGKSNRPPQTRRTRQQPQQPLYPPEACQSIHEQIPSNCSGCGHPLSGEDETPHRHQVVELPPIIPAVTEYRLHRLRCSHCGTTTRGQLPSGVSQRCYGERLAGVVALLSGEYRQSHRQVSQLLSALFSIRLSRQSINRARQEVSAAVSQSVCVVTVGQGYSSLAWIPEAQGSWALPLCHERITSWESPLTKAAFQLKQVCNVLPSRPLTLWDSEYGCASFVLKTADIAADKLMRLRPNRTLWGAPPPYSGRGRPRVHGERFKLNEPST